MARSNPVFLTEGTTDNQIKRGSAANLAGASSNESLLTSQPGEWAVTHAPAANTAAVASKAAGAAGVRRVFTGAVITVANGAVAPTAALLTVNLRDGATGAGTILATFTLAFTAVAGACNVFNITGRKVPGTAATAMTLETSAAPGANVSVSITLFGHDAA